MAPYLLTHWLLDAKDRPGAIIVVRIIAQQDGREFITAPLVEHLPARKVRTAERMVWRLGCRQRV